MLPVHEILGLARWAPSGDNSQPWRFEVVPDDRVIVHILETRDLYDLEGWASQIAVGAMLENMRIASSAHGLITEVARSEGTAEGELRFDVRFVPQRDLEPDPLLPFVEARTVHRRPLHPRPLTLAERQAFEASLGDDFAVLWREGWAARFAMARLLGANGRLRYSLYEGFEVHRRVIEPNARFSMDRIPDRAVGLDPFTRRLMAWALRDWKRVKFLNAYLGGTLLPTFELDFLTGMFCAAHALIVARTQPGGVDDYVRAGRAVQRFWLTATRLGMMMQPETTPLIFSSYARHGVRFSTKPGATDVATNLGTRLEQMFGRESLQRAVFMCRVGHGRTPTSRSLRLAVEALLRPSRANR